jgi:hypothetical protein
VISPMFFKAKRIKVDVFINYGKDRVQHHRMEVERGSSVIDALKAVADVEFIADDRATGHRGSIVAAINGIKSTRDHFWIYYVSDSDHPGWRIPMEMPDCIIVSDEMRIAWRYHDAASMKSARRFGPRFTSGCAGKAGSCARQF